MLLVDKMKNRQFKLKVLLRPALTVVFGFLGAFIARSGTPPGIFVVTGDYFLIVAFAAFAILGFILPDIIELMGKASLAVLAKQIAERIPIPPTPRLSVPRISLRRKNRRKIYENPLIVDTSALIDGRMLSVANAGFLSGSLLVIPSVIKELHKLADNADENKRVRGRRGLDVIGKLRHVKGIKVISLNTEPTDKEVDHKLVSLTRKSNGKLITVDFNLNKVAKAKGLKILNLNELANAVKTNIIPDSKLAIKIASLGKEKGQGVGYLDDGTMIVVEDGAGYKGKTISVKVHRVLQTEAGQMIFAKVAI